jgi:opacity protein-like surface antigen
MRIFIAILIALLGVAAAKSHAADIRPSSKDTPAHVLPSEQPSTAFSGAYAGVSVSWQSLDVEHGGSLSVIDGITKDGEFTYAPLDLDIFGNGRMNDLNDQAFRFGAQVGHQWRFGRIYTGPRFAVDFGELEADMKRVDVIADRQHFSAQHNGKLSVSSDFLATASWKLGVAVTENVGVYGIGGLSVSDIDVNANGSLSGEICDKEFNGALPWQASNSKTAVGYHIGAGVDFELGDWNAFAEYTYHDLGEVESRGTVYGGLIAYKHDADVTMNVVKIGVNRRF